MILSGNKQNKQPAGSLVVMDMNSIQDMVLLLSGLVVTKQTE
jgi:hypothetical protein